MNELVTQIVEETEYFVRNPQLPFVYLVDHCFSVKGKGTVMTGTIIQGTINKGDLLEIPQIGFSNKVKSIQMFKKSMKKASQGDRVGMLVNNLDPTEIERCLACEPGYVQPCNIVLGSFKKIRYWKKEITSKTKYHLSIGNTTIMATLYLGELTGEFLQIKDKLVKDNIQNKLTKHGLLLGSKLKYIESVDAKYKGDNLLAILILDKTIFMPLNSFFIASRLELGKTSTACRMVFSGRMIQTLTVPTTEESTLFTPELLGIELFNEKSKSGIIERFNSSTVAILKDMFKKGSNINDFVGSEVVFAGGKLTGTIQGSFGKKGKVKVGLLEAVSEEEQQGYIGTQGSVNFVKPIKIKK